MSAYSKWDLLLHRLALNSNRVQRVAFDLDCLMSRSEPTADRPERPTYVAGLARSGTTLLLQLLYESGAFVTLTYRHMPFVTAPRLWSKIAARHHRGGTRLERAHGDGMEIDFESPEAFEEPFWAMVADEPFVDDHGLHVHHLSDEGVSDYRRFVANVVAASGTPDARYLAKNNNNVLRIETLRRAFPDACIVVPFRDPWNHAASLLRQHERFSAMHAEEPDSLTYMNWLGHYEFGANFKPLLVGPDARPGDADELNRLDYWLRYWTAVHRYLLTAHAEAVSFFDYDRFCRDPSRGLKRLAEVVGLDPPRLTRLASKVRQPTGRDCDESDGEAPSEVADVYAALRENFRAGKQERFSI